MTSAAELRPCDSKTKNQNKNLSMKEKQRKPTAPSRWSGQRPYSSEEYTKGKS
jgi:hypothetical protein